MFKLNFYLVFGFDSNLYGSSPISIKNWKIKNYFSIKSTVRFRQETSLEIPTTREVIKLTLTI